MRKIVLISFYPGFFGINLRLLGACLIKAGFCVEYLHLGYANYKFGERTPTLLNFCFSKIITDNILNKIRNSLFVGISLASSEFIAARDFTIALKKVVNTTVVWGGPHPTASFEGCVRYADYVCIGEGEETIVDIANLLNEEKSIEHVQNLAYMKNGIIHVNQKREVIKDLDSLPIPDTEIYLHNVFINGELRKITPELLLDIDRIYIRPVPESVVYTAIVSRGCPNRCSYCNNSYLNRIYQGQKYFRYRSLNHLFMEIHQALTDIKQIGAVFFADDNLTALPNEVLFEFARRWTKEVGIPFGTSGSPSTITDYKIKILAETGLLYKFGVGIESGSQRMIDLYNRKETIQQSIKAINIVEKYREQFYQKHEKPVINYQFIFDNPYETNKDLSTTIRFILNYIKDPKSLTVFSLVIYPGSEIYIQSKKDKIFSIDKNIYQESFIELKPTFVKIWIALYRRGLPKWILRLLAAQIIFNILNSKICIKLYRKMF
ncbi:MAG: cobalamin-dependent protein [Syntrophotaleaceae bacterium]